MAAEAEEESQEQMEARHEAEDRELEERVLSHLEAVKASSGKGKKAKEKTEAAERDVEQWRYELRTRQQEERDALEERQAGAAEHAAPAARQEPAKPAATETGASKEAEEEAERVLRKKEKALKKRQLRSKKELDREEELERKQREAGPSARELELAAIAAQLAGLKPPLRVLEVTGDGHCLYRAVADQLRRFRPELHIWAKGPDRAHEEMRALCADALRLRSGEYEPFAELNDDEDFSSYCDRVENSADWGGELELRALADQLGAQVLVHRAGEPEPLVLGRAGTGAPLHVSYHQHWLALGEHYNSAALHESEGG